MYPNGYTGFPTLGLADILKIFYLFYSNTTYHNITNVLLPKEVDPNYIQQYIKSTSKINRNSDV